VTQSVASARPLGPAAPLPLTVLTGFLGAGKTTLLNRLVQAPELADTAVIINEFGEIGLDHLLVQSVRDDVVLLQSGCLCCTLRGDLVEALESLLRDLDNGRVAFRRIILETTGLADPAPVLQTAMSHSYLTLRFRLDGVITVVDAVNGAATLDQHMESVKQVAVADRLVLTKTDLVAADARATERLIARLKALNPAAMILDAAAGEARPERLVACGLFDPERKIPDVRRWLAAEAYATGVAVEPHGAHAHDDHAHQHDPHDRHDHHDRNRHDDRIRAFTLTADAPIPASVLEMFVDLLRSLHGPKLLRLKGIVQIAEEPDQPVVIHGVQHVMHPPVRLEHWPDADRTSRIVLITRDLTAEEVRPLFDAFLGRSAPDQPDRAALVDNPLVPFGGRDR
jgi:G3E family GTPase